MSLLPNLQLFLLIILIILSSLASAEGGGKQKVLICSNCKCNLEIQVLGLKKQETGLKKTCDRSKKTGARSSYLPKSWVLVWLFSARIPGRPGRAFRPMKAEPALL